MLLNQVEEAGMLLDGYPAALRNVVEIRVAPDLQALPGLTEETNKILVRTTIIEKEMEFFVQLSEGRNKCCSRSVATECFLIQLLKRFPAKMRVPSYNPDAKER